MKMDIRDDNFRPKMFGEQLAELRAENKKLIELNSQYLKSLIVANEFYEDIKTNHFPGYDYASHQYIKKSLDILK